MSNATIVVNKFIWSFTGISAHIMAGFIAVSKAKQYGGHKGLYIATGIGVTAAALKEFWYDENYEDIATRGSSFLDFSMYMTGIVLGWFF